MSDPDSLDASMNGYTSSTRSKDRASERNDGQSERASIGNVISQQNQWGGGVGDEGGVGESSRDVRHLLALQAAVRRR